MLQHTNSPDQVEQEIGIFLTMLDEVYGTFGLDYSMKLSTRPEKYLGELEQWNAAEKALEEALNKTGRPWEVRFLGGVCVDGCVCVRCFVCACVYRLYNTPYTTPLLSSTPPRKTTTAQ